MSFESAEYNWLNEPDISHEEAMYEHQCSLADKIEKELKSDANMATGAFINVIGRELSEDNYKLLKSIVDAALTYPFTARHDPFVILLKNAINEESMILAKLQMPVDDGGL